ncbi:MAG: peptidylprolyl isomerase [Eubacteriales bacterium]
MFNSKLLASLLACTLLLSSCSTPATSDEPISQVDENGVLTYNLDRITDPVETLSGLASDTVVATAGEVEITVGELLFFASSELTNYLSSLYSYGLTELPWDAADEEYTFAESFLQAALETTVLHKILPGIATDLEIELTQEDLDAISNLSVEVLASVDGNETFYQYLMWQSMLSDELFADNMKASSLYTHISNFYFTEGGEFYPSDDEILTLLEEESYFNTKHVLLATVDMSAPIYDDDGVFTGEFEPLSDEVIADAKSTALDIIDQLNAETEDRDELMSELMVLHTDDLDMTGAPNGIDGYQVGLGEMLEEYEAASLELEVGEISDIVETAYGYHVIYRLPLVADASTRSGLLNERAYELQNSWLEDAGVETNEVFDSIDLQTFYENLTALRTQINIILDEALSEPAIEDETDTSVESDSVEDDAEDSEEEALG